MLFINYVFLFFLFHFKIESFLKLVVYLQSLFCQNQNGQNPKNAQLNLYLIIKFWSNTSLCSVNIFFEYLLIYSMYILLQSLYYLPVPWNICRPLIIYNFSRKLNNLTVNLKNVLPVLLEYSAEQKTNCFQ